MKPTPNPLGYCGIASLPYLPPKIEKQIELAISILVSGGLVAFPTDTVYGLGASAFIDRAVKRVYEVKGRPHHLPLPLLLADISEIGMVAYPVPEIAWRLAERFLPGGLTLVLPKAPSLTTIATAGGNTVAVRIPNHPIPLALIRGLAAPLTGTSANISGRASPVTAEEVSHQMGGSVELIIDGGRCPGGIESTVLDITGEVPRILREGAISREDIERACGMVVDVA